MDAQFPSNSHERPNPQPAPTDANPAKRVEKAVTGKVHERKRPLGKRFLDTFTGGDARGALDYVIMEVLIPAAKDAIADATSQGIERIVFGEARSRSRRPSRYGSPSSYSGGTNSYTRYSSPTTANSRPTYNEPARTVSNRSRMTHDFKEIVLETRVEAEDVLSQLESLLDRYRSVTVKDFYDLVGITGQYTDSKWGWLEIKRADIVRVRDGYLIDLPRPEPID